MLRVTGACLAALLLVAAPARAARDFVDDAGRRVSLPDKVERVYAAGPPASVLVFALAPDKLLGWTRAFRPNEKAWVPAKYADLPELGRLTGRGNTANVEVVLRARPDLIVDIGSTAATFASLADRVQQQTGIPYILLDGRLETTPMQIEKLARALGAEARGGELAAHWKSRIDPLRERIAAIPADRRPSVYYARGPQGLVTGLGGSINVEMIEFLGARNVAGGERGGLAQVGFEQVVLWDPPVVVTNDPNFMREVWKAPVWQGVTAVRRKRVYLSPHLPFGWFDYPPGANRLVGLLWLAEILYPDHFRHDFPKEIAAFYKLFYHQEPTAAQVAGLLAEPGVAPR
ncbi:MAG: iron ABC transporter substrate-binding protein [Burkholderiales bacterium]|nr:iron ABC transporter substrate-binding protein [Burkholderiales bacterium]MBZ0249405.1 iron ABC transporter substrate-binding protein [Burkholderiales bacterium]MCL4688527.1 iron ABC transporter substrate-binding protein [Burkholderiales bacterium]